MNSLAQHFDVFSVPSVSLWCDELISMDSFMRLMTKKRLEVEKAIAEGLTSSLGGARS